MKRNTEQIMLNRCDDFADSSVDKDKMSRTVTHQLSIFWDCRGEKNRELNHLFHHLFKWKQQAASNWTVTRLLTLWWCEEIEEGVVGDCFGDRPDCAAALVLLFLLDCFQRDVLALRPFDRAAVVKHEEEKPRSVSNISNGKIWMTAWILDTKWHTLYLNCSIYQ